MRILFFITILTAMILLDRVDSKYINPSNANSIHISTTISRKHRQIDQNSFVALLKNFNNELNYLLLPHRTKWVCQSRKKGLFL